MTEIAEAMFKFWNSFKIKGFPEGGVESGTKFPYLTYTLGRNDYIDNGMQQVRLWYKTSSFTEINAKIDVIEDTVDNGVRIPLENGCLYICKGTPFAQFQPSDEPSVKIAYLNLEVSYLTK